MLKVMKLALAMAVISAGASCTQKSTDGDLMVYHGTHYEDVKTLDPANAYDTISLDVVSSVYETLYQYAYLSDSYKVAPLLAADYPKLSADKLTVTIPLKRNVKFQDDPAFKESGGKGRELKAQDFAYAFKRLALPSVQSSGFWVFDDKLVGFNEFHEKLVKTARGDLPKAFEDAISGIKALDDYTLQLKFKKPYPQLLFILSMPFTAPVPHEAVAAYADENGNLTEHPIGTGPFVLKTWKRGHEVVLERNPNYHPDFYPTEGSVEYRKRGLLADAGKPLPFLDRVHLKVVKEDQPKWLNFLKGKSDVSVVPKDNFNSAIVNQNTLSSDLVAKGIKLSVETGTRFYYVSLNMKDKLLGSNKFLRQAISASIDREKWIELFTNGRGKKMVNSLPPGLPDRPKTSKIKFDYNPALAKELLKKAGYPEGRGLPTINFDMRGADSINRQMGEYFTRQLDAVGIKLNVIYNTFPAYLTKLKDGNLQLSYGGWGLDYPDAENVYQLVYGPNKAPGPNDSNFDHETVNRNYEQIILMESGSKRSELIQQIDDILQEDVPWAYGYYHAEYYLSQPWLLNFRPSEIILNKYKYYRINKDVKNRYLEGK